MIKLYSPRNEIELAFIKSIFEAEGIPYFVHNDHYGSLEIGPSINLFNAKTIFITPESKERATELIADYLKNVEESTAETDGIRKSSYSICDKIRIVIEALIFGWFMPGKRWQKKSRQKDNK